MTPHGSRRNASEFDADRLTVCHACGIGLTLWFVELLDHEARTMLQRLRHWIDRLKRISTCGSTRDDHELGRRGEELAAKVLRAKGYRILAQGHRQRLGEIDLVALDGRTIVFVEVKTRESDRQGDPAEAVDLSKQEKLTRAALIYLKRRNLLEQPCRFDVVSIVWPQLRKTEPAVRHYIHAFEAVGPYRMFN